MSKEKRQPNEIPTKLLPVTSCKNCSQCKLQDSAQICHANPKALMDVTEAYDKNIFPANCPLPFVEDFFNYDSVLEINGVAYWFDEQNLYKMVENAIPPGSKTVVVFKKFKTGDVQVMYERLEPLKSKIIT